MEGDCVITRWFGSKWLIALLCGLLGYAIELVRVEPSFGVGLSFWVFPALFAATFLGVWSGIAAGIVSTFLLGFTTQQFFDPADGIVSLAMVVFVANYLQVTKSRRVVDAVCLFWLFAAPLFIFYHRNLWLLDIDGGLLLLAREVASHLLPALLVQWIALKPAFYHRWLPASLLRRGIANNFTIMATARLVLIPATLLPVLFATQLFTTESLFIRQQSFLNEAEQLSIVHVKQLELALAKARLSALAAPGEQALTYKAWAKTYLAALPWVCGISHERFNTQVADATVDPGSKVACTAQADHSLYSSLASLRVGELTLWLDLNQLNDTIEAVEREVTLEHSSRLWRGTTDANSLGKTTITSLPDRGKSTVEALFRRKSARVEPIDSVLLSEPIFVQVEVMLSKPTDRGLAVSLGSLLATLVFMFVLFVLYRRWLGLIGHGISAFVARVSQWQIGDSPPELTALQLGELQELTAVGNAFQRLTGKVNHDYNALNDLSGERRLLLKQMSAVYESIHAPIFVFDRDINPLPDQSNFAAMALIDTLNPVFEKARTALAHQRANPQALRAEKSTPAAGLTLSQALSEAAAFGRSATDIELSVKAIDNNVAKQYLCAIDIIFDDAGAADMPQGLVLVLADVTEQLQIRQQLMHSTKMVSIGEVASGAAHELNQPLNIIRMATHNVLRVLSKGDVPAEQVKAKLERINAQVDRAARLVSGMKAFSRTSHEILALVNPSEPISVALDLLAKRIHAEQISVSYEPLALACELETDPSALQQIIIVLVDNAIDAFAARSISGRYLTVSESLLGGDFVLTVSDNAGGIDPAILDKIFEPFFTTRQRVGNSGLGLSTIYGIVAELGGTITAANGDQGAIFTVILPAAKPELHSTEINPG